MGRPRIYTDEEYLERRRAISREWNRKHAYQRKQRPPRSGDKAYVPSPNPGMSTVDNPRRVSCPQYLLEDRDRRFAYQPTVTEYCCGDPRPGQSALDQKRNAGELQ